MSKKDFQKVNQRHNNREDAALRSSGRANREDGAFQSVPVSPAGAGIGRNPIGVRPRFLPGDRVTAYNHKRQAHEPGEVEASWTSWRADGSFHHSFTIKFDQPGEDNFFIRSLLTEDKILNPVKG